MEKAFSDCHAPIYDNHYLWEAVIKLLEIAMNYTSQIIEWWIYEAKFGANSKMNIVENKNNKEIIITLFMAEELYNYLKTNDMAYEINKIQTYFEELRSIIISHKNRAYQAVNTELITTYWEVGKFVSYRIKSEQWVLVL